MPKLQTSGRLCHFLNHHEFAANLGEALTPTTTTGPIAEVTVGTTIRNESNRPVRAFAGVGMFRLESRIELGDVGKALGLPTERVQSSHGAFARVGFGVSMNSRVAFVADTQLPLGQKDGLDTVRVSLVVGVWR